MKFINITTRNSEGTRNWTLKYSCAFALEVAVRTAIRVMRDNGDKRSEGELIDAAVEAVYYTDTLRLFQTTPKECFTFDWKFVMGPLILPGDDVELAG